MEVAFAYLMMKIIVDMLYKLQISISSICDGFVIVPPC
jgi:hypothetical protein